jgi:hypothetical protein
MQRKAFHEKWIVHLAGRETEFLQACDSSTLAAFGLSYERIGQLKPFPADRGALVTLAIAVAARLCRLLALRCPRNDYGRL